MKKIIKISLWILLDIFLLVCLVGLLLFVNDESKIEVFKVDISKFSGRVISADNIKPGTFTIKVPMLEALKFGKDAILSYGVNGVRIWKPDTSTTGVFLYSSITPRNINVKYYDAFLVGKEIILKGHLKPFAYFVYTILSLIFFGLNLGGVFYTKQAFKR
ncbi:MAG: hypothetical protein WC249_04110 [Patescibacteria group bacterium]